MATRTKTKAKRKTLVKAGVMTRARAFDRDKAATLAETITGSRQQFAEAFRRAQAGRQSVLELEAVVSSKPHKVAAFTEGFLRAAERGWLVDLCVACLDAQIVSGAFAVAAAGIADDARLAKLQLIVDGHRGIPDAGLFVDRLPRALRQVCRIEIDGDPRGTGFLIRSDLVMTAYHVVRPLLQQDNTPFSGSAGRIRVRFDYSRREAPSGEVTLIEGLLCRVADPWLVTTSPCTADELLDRLPEDEEKLLGFWDFAVIRLAEMPGVPRAGLEIGGAPLARGRRLMILQHPKTRPVGIDTSTVRRFLGSGRFRIVHGVNTEDGSSGSPCLDDDFKVVGLHQAGMQGARKVKGKEDAEEVKENRAIPMPRILEAWDPKTAPPVALPFGRLLTVDTRDVRQHPVFGRAKLQEWIGRTSAGDGTATAKRDRFLVVSGPKGSGKSFTTDVLRAMLPSGEHSVLECRASDFTTETTALGFASKYLLGPLGANASALPGLNQADTSDNAWLNYQFTGALLAAMDQSRKNRTVWLVLDELDEVALPDQGQVRKLLDLIYSRATTTPWLRFVLIGVDAVPIAGTVPLTERDFPGPITEAALEADVGDYLLRLFDLKRIPVNETTIRAAAASIVRILVRFCGGDLRHPNLLRMVAEQTIAFEESHGLTSAGPI
jgi:hypothetical protein